MGGLITRGRKGVMRRGGEPWSFEGEVVKGWVFDGGRMLVGLMERWY